MRNKKNEVMIIIDLFIHAEARQRQGRASSRRLIESRMVNGDDAGRSCYVLDVCVCVFTLNS